LYAGVATLGLPDSPGVPSSATSDTLVATYNDLRSVEKLLNEHADIAAVILEPVVGNAGFIKPSKQFLEGLRELTKKHGALLVFDEVMTGFRVAYGGAQEHYGVIPDLTTLGKVIGLSSSSPLLLVHLLEGGGLPVGAYGGKKEIMSMVAPAGPVYQAGTLSGNPLAMSAGIATLHILRRPGTYEHLDNITASLVNGIIAAGKEAGHDVSGAHVGGMFGFFFHRGPVNSFDDAKRSDVAKFAKFHRLMLERGVYLAPSPFEAGFTSLAHTHEDIDKTLQIVREVMRML
jgi:glutamate-1-semialdehyde 2,1-aminomutase